MFPKQSRLSVGAPLGISQSPYLGKFPATSGLHEILLKNERQKIHWFGQKIFHSFYIWNISSSIEQFIDVMDIELH